jgi:hypothetical protein
MQTKLEIPVFIPHEREGDYFTVPFHMPVDVESLVLRYRYEHHRETVSGSFVARTEVNIIDLGLIGVDGEQVGASGSDKDEITVSETSATAGYRALALVPGEWRIIVGAYKIVPEGMTVAYELIFTYKERRLFKGDLHAHTLASDGVLTAEELGTHARRHGLDYLAITDHNQMITRDALPRIPHLTLIPGLEWTHFKGHANFLGVERPYDGSFIANTPDEVRAHFEAARERGALIVINHPFDEGVRFQFDLNALPYDCLEVWNGPMREANLRAVGLWQSLLVSGKKLPICGGSDYHRSTPFIFLGGPTTCVYAPSRGASDILAALRQGHAYIVFSPEGPALDLSAGSAIMANAIMGDSVPWPQVREMYIKADGLLAGDVIRVVTANGSVPVLEAPQPGRFEGSFDMVEPGFARVEILRAFLPGLPLLPALISNPIYFES